MTSPPTAAEVSRAIALAEWRSPRELLARHGLEPKRGFSQNFLVSEPHTRRIAELAARPGLPVVELGPGLGTLTGLLLAGAPHVTAVEADRDMVRILGEEFPAHPRLLTVLGDAVTFDLSAEARGRGGEIVVAGNLPYAVTGGIMRNLVTHAPVVRAAYLMVQREVRDRLVAAPSTKTYGALTVFVRSRYRTRAALELSAGCFYPPPKVASSVVEFKPRTPLPEAPFGAFEWAVRAAFQARRKTLRNALLSGFARDPDHEARVDEALGAAGIDGKRRGETLSVEEFESLATAWHALAMPTPADESPLD